MVVFGGYSDKGYSNDLIIINIIEQRFENPLTTGNPPSARESFAMEFINGNIYIFGGFAEGAVLNDIYKLDLSTLTWSAVITQGPRFPERQGFASARVGQKLYITGGCDFRQQLCYTETYILDIETLWWTKVENSKSDLTARGGFSLAVFRGNLVAHAGCEMYKHCYNNTLIFNINELCPNKCNRNGECKDQIGCVCNPTFGTHDCSITIKCKEDCNKNGLCHNNAKCGCFPGWGGSTCNSLIDCAKNCTSSENGICQTDRTCKCKDGYTGNDCSERTNNKTDADALQILANEAAKDVNSKNKELAKDSVILSQGLGISNTTANISCLNNCGGNGQCNYTTGNCSCNSNFTGNDCDNKAIVVVPLKRQEAEIADKDEKEEEDDKPDNTTDIKNEHVIVTFSVGSNHDIYVRTNDCSANCTSRGICLNSTCFCDQGYSSNDCSMTYKQYLEQGYKFTDMIMYLVIAFVTATILTLIILIFRRSQKVSGDHLELGN